MTIPQWVQAHATRVKQETDSALDYGPNSDRFRPGSGINGNSSARTSSIICKYRGDKISEAKSDKPIVNREPYVADLTPFGASWLQWQPLGKAGMATQAMKVTNFLALQASLANRPLKPSEADATVQLLADQDYKLDQYKFGAGVLGAGALVWRMRKTPYPLPFLSERRPTFNPDSFKLFWTVPIKGNLARALHRLTSAQLYIGGTMLLGAIIGSVYTEAELAIRLGTDPRTKDLMKQSIKNVQNGRSQQPASRTPGSAPQNPVQGQTTGQSQGQWKVPSFPRYQGQGDKTSSPYGDTDDGSPSSDSFNNADEMSRQDDASVSQSNEDKYSTPAQSTPSQSTPFSRPSQSRPPISQQSPPTRRTYDDASPTADPFEDSSSDQQQGSIWDRLRRQGGPSSESEPGTRRVKPNNDRSSQKRTPPKDNDYTFNRADEERQLPQEEAQAKFDATVERERNGGNDDLDAENRKWK